MQGGLRKYGVSGTLVRFINAIARKVKAAVEAEFPNRKIFIVTFAYYFSIKAPVEKSTASSFRSTRA